MKHYIRLDFMEEALSKLDLRAKDKKILNEIYLEGKTIQELSELYSLAPSSIYYRFNSAKENFNEKVALNEDFINKFKSFCKYL